MGYYRCAYWLFFVFFCKLSLFLIRNIECYGPSFLPIGLFMVCNLQPTLHLDRIHLQFHGSSCWRHVQRLLPCPQRQTQCKGAVQPLWVVWIRWRLELACICRFFVRHAHNMNSVVWHLTVPDISLSASLYLRYFQDWHTQSLLWRLKSTLGFFISTVSLPCIVSNGRLFMQTIIPAFSWLFGILTYVLAFLNIQ